MLTSYDMTRYPSKFLPSYFSFDNMIQCLSFVPFLSEDTHIMEPGYNNNNSDLLLMTIGKTDEYCKSMIITVIETSGYNCNIDIYQNIYPVFQKGSNQFVSHLSKHDKMNTINRRLA